MKRSMSTRMTLAGAAAALALGAVACEMEDPNGLDDPLQDDVMGDDLLEGEDL